MCCLFFLPLLILLWLYKNISFHVLSVVNQKSENSTIKSIKSH